MIVYWSPFAPIEEYIAEKGFKPAPFAKYLEPTKLIDFKFDFDYDDMTKSDDFEKCPAYIDYTRNTYALRFPFDYKLNFDWNDNRITCEMYDQHFYDEVFKIRSFKNKLFTISSCYLFKTEQPLIVECFGASFSNNDFSKKAILIPGQFDISTWFRYLECSFLFRDQVENLTINRGDAYAYLRFKTDEPITFKKFYPSDRIMEIYKETTFIKGYNKKFPKPLTFFYNMYQQSKLDGMLMKEIKNNLLE